MQRNAYIDTPYRYTGHSPYWAPKSTLKAGFLEGQRPKLQSLVDRTLNRAGGNQYRFVVPIRHVLLTVLYSPLVKSMDALDKSRGGVTETDVAIWTLVYGGAVGQELNWQLYWMPNFIFVDVGTAVATGREVYGFPKQMCRATIGADTDFATRVSAIGLEQFDPLGVGRELDVLEIREVDKAQHVPTDGATLEKTLRSWMKTTLNPAMNNNWVRDLVAPHASMPMVFLKQIPDIRNSHNAALRQLTAANNNTIKVHRMKLMQSEFEVDLHASASFQIAKTLGVNSRTKLQFPFFVEMDFIAETGRVFGQAA